MSRRSLILHNFWLKLFSLLLASLIWIFIRYRNKSDLDLRQTSVVNLTTRDSMHLPVTVMLTPGDERVFKINPKEVFVSVAGESAVLNELLRKDFKAYVDLTDVRHEESSYRVRMHVPVGVTVLRIVPLAVNVEQNLPPRVESKPVNE